MGMDGDAERATRQAAMMLYVGAVILAGAGLLVQFAPRTYPRPWFALALLLSALILSLFKLRLPLGRGNSTMSMAYAVDFAALIITGPGLATVVAAAGVLMQCTVRVKRRQPIYRTAFSVASVIIAVQVAGVVWQALGGDVDAPGIISSLVMPLSGAAMTYFAVNTVLVAGAIALSSGVSAVREWNREFFWSAPAYFLSAAVAGMIALAMAHGAYILLPLAASPLYLSYRAYRMSVGRIEEERRHAQELAGMIATTQQALARATESEAALAAEKDRLAIMSARLGVTLRTISDGVLTVDRSGAIVLTNEGAQKLCSVTPQEALERTVAQMLSGLGFNHEECTAALHRVLEEGSAVRMRNEEPGSAERLVEVTGTPTRDTDGQVAGAVWVLRDITDEALVEHERAKSARLESLGVLAGGLAHDFNNILMGVTGNLSLAQAMVPAEDKALLARLTNASAACARARGVTNQLLTFSKGGAPVKKTASVRELVTECTRFALSGSPVAPAFDVNPDLWAAEVDASQIGQVVQNLVLNAMQAMARGGVLEVSLDNVEYDADTVPASTKIAPGRYVLLKVKDGGTGIPPEVLARIFDPYFTTKKSGSGLGLAISYSIVRAHGGSITVESEPGVGSTFTVYLPASSTPAAAPVIVRPEMTRRTGRVLIMDDEDMVAEVAQEMIESLGYTVKRACNGDEALKMFNEAEQTGEPFDLVFLDLTVPGGMGGAETVKYIKEMRADVPCIVASGYADDTVLARYTDFGFDGVLPKPFTIPELRRTLQEMEDAGSSPQQGDWATDLAEAATA
jgi:PAS domain S-box-containing protein